MWVDEVDGGAVANEAGSDQAGSESRQSGTEPKAATTQIVTATSSQIRNACYVAIRKKELVVTRITS